MLGCAPSSTIIGSLIPTSSSKYSAKAAPQERQATDQRLMSRRAAQKCVCVSLRRRPCAGNYDEYFGLATDVEAVVYLMLCNQLLHDVFPTVTIIGEDVSGMPTFCRCAPVHATLAPACSSSHLWARCARLLPVRARARHAGTSLFVVAPLGSVCPPSAGARPCAPRWHQPVGPNAPGLGVPTFCRCAPMRATLAPACWS